MESSSYLKGLQCGDELPIVGKEYLMSGGQKTSTLWDEQHQVGFGPLKQISGLPGMYGLKT